MQLTPEEQLILASVKIHPETTDLARLAALVPQVKNWEYVVERAVATGIAPLLFKKTGMLENSHLIPETAIKSLQNSYYKTFARSMRIYDAYRKVAEAFNADSLKFVVLKGAFLCENLYNDLGLRQFSDIDILVSEINAEKILEILSRLGYKSRTEFHSEFIARSSEIVHFPPLMLGEISIEVHIKLHRSNKNYNLKITSMLSDAVSVFIQGIPAHTLRLDDQLIHLCVHAEKHFRSGHVQFTCYNDITNLLAVHHNTFNWHNFEERCRLHGCERVVFNQLMLAHQFCFVPVDKNLIQKHQTDFVPDDVELFIRYFRGDTFSVSLIPTLSNSIKKFKKLSERILYIRDMIHPSKSFMINKYQIKKPKWYFLFYPYRYFLGLKTLFRRKHF